MKVNNQILKALTCWQMWVESGYWTWKSCETGAYRIEFLDLKPITCAVNQLPSIMLHMNLGKVSFGSGVILVIALSTQLMQ